MMLAIVFVVDVAIDHAQQAVRDGASLYNKAADTRTDSSAARDATTRRHG